LHGCAQGSPELIDKSKLTGAGCILTLLSAAVIIGVAFPIMRWRHPATGQPLPRFVAVVAPVLIGAAVHGIGTLLLKLIGLRVWSKGDAGAPKKAEPASRTNDLIAIDPDRSLKRS
jgi:hypothetical protein